MINLEKNMRFKSHKKSICVSILIVTIIAYALSLYYNSLNNLYIRAALTDRPSVQYYNIVEKIFKKITINDMAKIANDIYDNKSINLHELYIYTLGIFGYDDPKGYYTKLMTKYNDNNENISIINNIYLSMGMSGGGEYIDILKESLEKQDNINIAYRRYLIALSMYLLTGKSCLYINPQGEKESFKIQNYMVNAREVINNSNNRIRTFDEMITLDRLTRPHGW